MATSRFLRTTTSVVMAVADRRGWRCATANAMLREGRIIARRALLGRAAPIRAESRRIPRAMCPGPEIDSTLSGSADGRALLEERPRFEQHGQRRVRQCRGAGLLGQFFAAGAGHDGVMQVRRRRQPEAALQPDLPWQSTSSKSAPRTTWVTPWNRVVDDDRKLIREQAVGAQHHEVADVAREHLLSATPAGDRQR